MYYSVKAFEDKCTPFYLNNLNHIFNYIKLELDSDAKLLEIGSGPSLVLSMMACNAFSEIYLSDYLEGNRTELMKVLTEAPDAFDWKPYINYARSKNVTLNENVLKLLRIKVKAVLECDVKRGQVLSEQIDKVDAVACMLCLCAACESNDEFQAALKRIVNFLKPGGYYIHSGMLHQTYYNSGENYFHTLSITKDEVMKAFEENGIEIRGWYDLDCSVETTTTSPTGTKFYVCYGIKQII
jgi:hypothetical protein